MKIRWTRDSLRLRITPSELEAVGSGESLHESLAFPGGLCWTVALRPGRTETALNSQGQCLVLSLSPSDQAALAQPETEGIYFQENGLPPLRYYVEKDFPCAHPRAAQSQEPVTQTFEAPRASKNERRREDPMATDLVGWGFAPGDGEQPSDRDEENDQEWDTPPTKPRPGPLHSPGSKRAARQADQDASLARATGDGAFAATREADAGDLRQSRWDWGDGRTWAWIVGMCVAFLLFCAFVYVLPQSRHNQNDLPAPTPPIRVY